MMKRWLSLMAVFCLAVIMMAGCKKNSPSSLTSESEISTSDSEQPQSSDAGSDTSNSEPSESSPQTGSGNNPGSNNPTPNVIKPTFANNTGGEVVSSMEVFNVKKYGAAGNGQGDDSAAIQKAIDAAASAGGGVVYLPHGVYSVKSTIVKKAKVSIVGDNMQSTTLRWTGGNNGVIIDTANQALWGTSIERLTFTKSSGKEITGILGGSTIQKYNSAIGTFKDLTFTSLEYAIRGNAEAGKDRSIGIFDCYFENIYISGSKRGLWLLGSGNTIVHPRIVQCDAGLVLDFLSWESMDGIHMIGGVFIQNKVDILLPNKTCLRPCNFVGTWFEQSSEGIVKIENPYTRVQTLTFRDCMLSTNDNVPCILDFTNAGFGNVIVDGCSIIAKNPTIKAPAKHAQYGGKLVERDNYVWK